MSFNPLWPKWVLSAIVQNIEAVKGGYKVFYEQQPRNANLGPAWYEIETSGCGVLERPKDFFFLTIDVHVTVSVAIDNDFYHIDNMLGDAVAFLPKTITVKQDDGVTFVGCLVQKDQNNETISVRKYGQIDKTVRLLKATLESRYQIELP